MTREYKKERGYFTFAQNGRHDYLRMAYGLALSLKATQSEVSDLAVAVTPGTDIPDHYKEVIDEIIEIPWGDQAAGSDWKLENEWKAFHITPYRNTIKLDCDMLFTQDHSRMWDIYETKDVWACTSIMDYRAKITTNDHYRKYFTENKLPNVYSAFTFFKESDTANELFTMMEHIYHNWEEFNKRYIDNYQDEGVNTDVAYALAIKLLGIEDEVTDPRGYPRFVHMKTKLQGWDRNIQEDWIKQIGVNFTDDLELKIGLYSQRYPVHYYIKEFLTDEMIETYERYLGISNGK